LVRLAKSKAIDPWRTSTLIPSVLSWWWVSLAPSFSDVLTDCNAVAAAMMPENVLFVPFCHNHEPRGGFYMWISNKRNAWGKVAHLCIIFFLFFFSSPGISDIPLVDKLEVNSFVAKVWRIPLAKGDDYMA
jgi:hypothetical protein